MIKIDHPQTKTHAIMVGGSKLYGLETPESDTDYRGIYATTDIEVAAGFKDHSSIVTTGEIDATFYEMGHFLSLLKKTNTQVMEILFAPESSFTTLSPEFTWLRSKKFELFDSERLKHSLIGYMHSETLLACGERQGQLGSLRKKKVERYGFSPKNFVQILRLFFVGKYLYMHGHYIVRISDIDKEYHDLLMHIKTNPADFNKDQLVAMVNSGKEELISVMENSKFKTQFNSQLASKILLNERAKLL